MPYPDLDAIDAMIDPNDELGPEDWRRLVLGMGRSLPPLMAARNPVPGALGTPPSVANPNEAAPGAPPYRAASPLDPLRKAGEEVRETLGEAPQYHDPGPVSGKRRFFGALLGGLAGFAGPEAGIETARGIVEAPRRRALEDYERRMEQYETAVSGKQIGFKEAQAVAAAQRDEELRQAQANYYTERANELARRPAVRPAGTAMGHYLQEHPDATDEDIQKYQQSLRQQGNQGFQEQAYTEWLASHPGGSRLDFERAEAIGRRDTSQQNTARSDRSYNFQAGRIDKLAGPIQERAERIGRLSDTLAQGTPQSDALVAPELLSIMAGGAASGLRMNEAEIRRIVGGRTNWEELKAKLGAFQADPNRGFALTPAQRQQVRELFTATRQRIASKLSAIDEGHEQLVNSDDPKEHRRIYNRLAGRLHEIDAGRGNEQGGRNQPPPGDDFFSQFGGVKHQ